MKVQLGADVITHDGEKIGAVKQAVIDPADQEITHLIVEKGFLFTEAKVLPLSLVLQADEEQVKLIETDIDPEKLPDYQEESYFPVENTMVYDPELALSRSFLAAKPRIVPQQEENVRIIKQTDGDQNLPEDTELLKIGARVTTLEGKKVGQIQELVVDGQTNQVTHLVISRGLFNKEQALIPQNWVKEITSQAVTLKVDENVLQNLPPYLKQE